MDVMAQTTSITLAIELIINAGINQSPNTKESIGSPVFIDIHALNKIRGDHRPSATNEIAKIIEIDSFMTN